MESYIWLLERHRDDASPTYDCTNAIVVAAGSMLEARMLAARNHGDEGESTWTGNDGSTCKLIGVVRGDLEYQVICRDFHAG